MKGKAPVRRTLKYLNAGAIIFRDNVKVVTMNFMTSGEASYGARDFVFWHLPQMQYKNPDVQILSIKNLTPTPFIRAWFDSGEDVLMDVYMKSREEIHSQVNKILGKSQAKLLEEAKAAEKQDNPANFGYNCLRHCICEIPGQVPCPSIVKLPNHMRGKYRYGLHADAS